MIVLFEGRIRKVVFLRDNQESSVVRGDNNQENDVVLGD
jgi:hypothetical protein